MPSHDDAPPTTEAFDPDVAVRRLDALIAAQLACVMNHSLLVALRDAWLGVGWLMERLPEDNGIVVSLLNVTVPELRDDFARSQRGQALHEHLVRDVYEDGDALPWTVIAIHEELTVGDESVIEAIAELAEESSTVALLNGSPELATHWSPPPHREQHRYAALLAPSIRLDTWNLPASHAALLTMAHSFSAYRHESNCVGRGGHVRLGRDIPSRTEEEAVVLAARGIASWSGDGDSVYFGALPSLALPRDIKSFGPHDGWLEVWIPYLLYMLRFVRIMRLVARHLAAEQEPASELSRAVHEYVTDSYVHDDAFRLAHPLRAARFSGSTASFGQG